MARITIEDCVPAVPNRFELVILAARRARELAGGSDPRVPRDHDKNTIVALREIAGRGVTADELRLRVIDQISAPRLPEKTPDEEIMEDLEAVCVTEDDDE